MPRVIPLEVKTIKNRNGEVTVSTRLEMQMVYDEPAWRVLHLSPLRIEEILLRHMQEYIRRRQWEISNALAKPY